MHVLIALVDSGNTTRFITQHAPNAVVFAVDQWANDALLLDPHYDGEEHQRVLKGPPLYDSFIANTWELRGSMEADDQVAGVVPLHMSTTEALRWLHAAGLSPDLIYVDAARHYEPVFADLSDCRRFFPDARLCGAAWECSLVARAVREVSWRFGDGCLHAEDGKAWVLGALDSHEALVKTRDRFYDDESSAEEHLPLFREVQSAFGHGPDGEAAVRHLLGKSGNCNGLSINFVAPPKGRTLLMAAAEGGFVDVARVLIEEFGANVNAQTKQKGETALHLSAYRGHLRMVKLLLSFGASTTLRNGYHETAFDTATSAGKNNAAAADCAAALAASAQPQR